MAQRAERTQTKPEADKATLRSTIIRGAGVVAVAAIAVIGLDHLTGNSISCEGSRTVTAKSGDTMHGLLNDAFNPDGQHNPRALTDAGIAHIEDTTGEDFDVNIQIGQPIEGFPEDC